MSVVVPVGPRVSVAPLLLILATLLCLGSACGGTPDDRQAADRVVDVKESYPIAGSTGQELRWALDRLGPLHDDGHRYDALTKWNFEYAYGREETPAGCHATALETTTTITTILPRWTPDPAAPAGLVARWEEYVACAALHENGHRRIYLDALERFRSHIESLGDHPTCAALDDAVARAEAAELVAVRTEQSDYEARTDHGHAQCGTFP